MASTDPVNPSGSNDPDYCVGTLLMKGESGRIYVDNPAVPFLYKLVAVELRTLTDVAN